MSRSLVLTAAERGYEFEVAAGRSVVLGRRRGDAVDICIPDVTVARRHARLFEREGRWYIEDLGSPSGIYVNGSCRQSETPIGPGDCIRLGRIEFQVHMRDAEEHTRVMTGDHCIRCGSAIFECQVREGLIYDHWYECAKCGCACPGCKCPMAYQEKDTSSGIEYRSYRCPSCAREGLVRQGIAMWKAHQLMNEQRKR